MTVYCSAYKPSSDKCIDRRLWPTQKTADERAKHMYYCQKYNYDFVSKYIIIFSIPIFSMLPDCSFPVFMR